MCMRKGFTLIELLAVIVILAIISLIAIPQILNLIKDSKEKSFLISEKNYIRAVEESIASKNLIEEFNPTKCIVKSDGSLTCDKGELKVETNGSRPSEGTILINKKEVKEVLNLEYKGIDKYINNVEGISYFKEEYTPVPDLMNDTLIPVIYDGENWIIADKYSKWYDYDKEEWANAVILKEEARDKKVGDTLNVPKSKEEINSSDILAMFVFIPRYEYTIKDKYGVGLFNETPTQALPGAIDIRFISEREEKKNGNAKYEGNTPSEWYTHPAFTFGSEELSGIWIGKFETSHTTKSHGNENTDANSVLGCADENCTEADNLRILPNVPSLRYNNVSNFFYASRSMAREGNPFKLDSTKTDTHMMKNSEWGAIAYLTQSKYGKYGNNDYTNGNKEVYKNDSSSYYTGRSSGKTGTDGYSSEGTCKYDEEKSTSEQFRTEGTGSCGGGASTTGNMYGIYDMSGGSWEYVMGYLTTASINWGATLSSNDAGFSEAPDLKYFDGYTSETPAKACDDKECKGHALSETSGWYGDNANFVSSSYPWLERGSRYDGGGVVGVFNFSYDNYGGNNIGYSFHVVFAPTN